MKRTAFKPKRKDGPTAPREVKPKACTTCDRTFTPARTTQVVCGRKCAEKKVRADLRARKEAIKTIPDLIKEAQREFNAFIRARDADKPCICCGEPLGGPAIGGGFDCGHYRSVGSAPHVRFDEANANGQRKACNRYGAGRAVDYRIGLVRRIGLAAVEALEADNRVHKWQRDELVAIKETYRRKVRELKEKT